MTPHWEVLGIGAAMIDYLVRVSEEFLESVPGAKHGMVSVDYDVLQDLLKRCGEIPITVAGGSAANTIKALASLGRSCALLASVGNDDAAAYFRKDFQDKGVTTLLIEKERATAQVLALIGPNGHRTFRTFLGSAALMKSEDLKEEYFSNSKLIHIEGYALQHGEVAHQAMTLAKAAGAKVSIDLSSHEIVTIHREVLLKLLREHATLVFCNEDEARILSKGGSAEDGCEILRHLCEVAVVSRGPLGCLVGNSERIQAFPAYPVEAIDTTGAGDFFTSGFLYGYLMQQPWHICAHYGAIMGNAVVQVVGADLPLTAWQDVKAKLSS